MSLGTASAEIPVFSTPPLSGRKIHRGQAQVLPQRQAPYTLSFSTALITRSAPGAREVAGLVTAPPDFPIQCLPHVRGVAFLASVLAGRPWRGMGLPPREDPLCVDVPLQSLDSPTTRLRSQLCVAEFTLHGAAPERIRPLESLSTLRVLTRDGRTHLLVHCEGVPPGRQAIGEKRWPQQAYRIRNRHHTCPGVRSPQTVAVAVCPSIECSTVSAQPGLHLHPAPKGFLGEDHETFFRVSTRVSSLSKTASKTESRK